MRRKTLELGLVYVQRKVRQHSLPLRSWRHEESQVESSEHQDNANIHYQSFPESVSEEHEIYTDYNGCHRDYVKHYSYPSVHFTTSFHFWASKADIRCNRISFRRHRQLCTLIG